MAPRYELEPLGPDEAARWDELISSYHGHELFQRRAWLDYLAESRGVQIRMWAIREGRQTIGYFCGGILRKGPFRILGSPLKSWGTNVMGPVVNDGFDLSRLLASLEHLAHEENLAMAELEHPILNEDLMLANNYEAVIGWTYLLRLDQDSESMWKTVYPTKRNKIRKAMKAGLTVEDTDDPGIADEFYDRYIDLMRRKGLVPPYPREYPRLLVRHLKKADLLFALRVRDSSGRVLATGLFPHDDHTVYFWGGSSWQEGRDLAPNDYLHWSLMRLAAERGLRLYNLCGYGRFKEQLGGELTTLKRWHKCFWRSAYWARRGYALYFQKMLRVKAWWQGGARLVQGS